MTRHDFFEQTYLASIDNDNGTTLVALLCRCIIAFRFEGVNEKTLYFQKPSKGSITSCKRGNHTQADTQFFHLFFRQDMRPILKMLFETLIKSLGLSYVMKPFRFSIAHLVDSINTFFSSFRLVLNLIARKEAFPFNLETFHCGKEYKSQWRYCQC